MFLAFDDSPTGSFRFQPRMYKYSTKGKSTQWRHINLTGLSLAAIFSQRIAGGTGRGAGVK